MAKVWIRKLAMPRGTARLPDRSNLSDMKKRSVSNQKDLDARFLDHALTEISLGRPGWRKLAKELEERFPKQFKLNDESDPDDLTGQDDD